MKHIALALGLALLSPYVCAQKIADQTRLVSEEDRNMNLAIAEARRTLDDFLALAKQPPAGASNFKLKVQVSDEYGVEHFWFSPFRQIEAGFAGVLANDPSVVKSVVAGKVYAFRREQITDWGYELNGKQIGSFTVCALFLTMPKEVVAQYKRDHGFQCDTQPGPQLQRVPTVTVWPSEELYPKALYSLGIQGVVELLATLGSDGMPSEVSVVVSSRSKELDSAAITVVKALQFGVKPTGQPASAVAPSKDLQVLVPVEFRRDSESSLKKKTCAEFSVDVNYFRATYPDRSEADLPALTMIKESSIRAEMKRITPRRLLDLNKRLTAAGQDIAGACAKSPTRLLVDQFQDLMARVDD